ncbi:MAG: hypothetical protein Ct9H300mP12_10930 [Acidimicrobiales bacterium]|nr:MAG: hypothetical protein Ct9H300mP12_10930 [Acidimicrobiales bacterium]
MTGSPAALRALAFASTAMVADSAMVVMRRESRSVLMDSPGMGTGKGRRPAQPASPSARSRPGTASAMVNQGAIAVRAVGSGAC